MRAWGLMWVQVWVLVGVQVWAILSARGPALHRSIIVSVEQMQAHRPHTATQELQCQSWPL